MPKDYFQIQNTTSLSQVPPGGKIHIIGVCGVAMGQLAVALAEKGYRISGSDKEFYEPMGSFLKHAKISLCRGYAASNVPADCDLVIIGNAISYGHPEVDQIEQRHLPYNCFPKALYELAIQGKLSIAICGTHGKSTTTALTATILKELGKEPSFFIGGVSNQLGTSLKVGTGQVSVVEGDEYDSAFFAKVPKFAFYHPDICVINAIEFDHADIYPDLAAVNREFDTLVKSLPKEAYALCCLDFENLRTLLKSWRSDAQCRLLTFGSAADADFRISSRRQEGNLQIVRFSSQETGEHELRLPLIGEYNARNALAATIAAWLSGGVKIEDAARVLRGVKTIKRRQELHLEKDGVVLLEDFAHHPTAVAQTLAAVREAYPGKTIWAIFEPRSNTSRRKIFQQEYIKAFELADRAIIAEVTVREIDKNQDLLDTHELSRAITASGTPCECLPDAKSIAAQVMEKISTNDLILVMSNGSFGGLIGMLKEQLEFYPTICDKR
ncbi:MAG: hypothetical protein GX589_06675 [Deltaproteobacteria bacterium]|nr:hypothetical protein [Deltaproteobacteria bacterium]